jgi:hypothetical protein
MLRSDRLTTGRILTTWGECFSVVEGMPMKSRLWWAGLCGGLAGSTLLAGAVALAQAEGTPPGPAANPAIPVKADRGKEFIELATETLVGNKAAPANENPKVEPGKVRWHPDLDVACKAATRSGKPVLVFHMMGRLDDRFC